MKNLLTYNTGYLKNYFFSRSDINNFDSITFSKSKTYVKGNHHHLNILIIDDEQICLDIADMYFASTNHNLAKANSGNIGLNYILENPKQIDLIILDLMMPDIHGLDILEQIKNTSTTKHIPVIVNTASSLAEDNKQAMKLGADFYLKKPYNKESLFNTINKIIESNKMEA